MSIVYTPADARDGRKQCMREVLMHGRGAGGGNRRSALCAYYFLFIFFTEGFSIKLAISLSESKNFIIFSKSLEILSKTFASFAS